LTPLSIDPIQDRMVFARALSDEAAGRTSEAVAGYRSLIARRPAFLAARIRISKLLKASGQVEEARQMLAGADGLSLFPSRIQVLSEH